MKRPRKKNDLLGEVYTSPPEHAERPRKKFKPWHKVRKQFIRNRHWCGEVKRIIPELKFDGRPLRYLGLPGSDMLDIQMLVKHICAPNSLQMKYLGFIKDDPQYNDDVTLSDHVLHQNKSVHKESLVIPDSYERIADNKTQAYRKTREYGPFDIVNLDLCDCLAKYKPLSHQTSYDALQNLLEIQKENADPWILFITTRTERKERDRQAMRLLSRCLNDNVDKYSDFKKEYNRESRKNINNKLLGELKKLGICFSKWLSQLLLSSEPRCRLELLPVYCYSTKGKGPNMLALAIKIEAISSPIVDGSGLTRRKKKTPRIDHEHLAAMQILHAMRDISNIDMKLRKENQLRNQLKKESVRLLAASGYSKGDYERWLKKHDKV